MIKLNNENLANYVEFKWDKLDNNFTEEELLKIEVLCQIVLVDISLMI